MKSPQSLTLEVPGDTGVETPSLARPGMNTLRMIRKYIPFAQAMLMGALVSQLYVRWRFPETAHEFAGAYITIMFGYSALGLVDHILRRRLGEPIRQRQPEPAWSGAGVILVTGAAATAMVGRISGLVPALIAAAATIIFAAWIWRFARTHEGRIGEARFGTTDRGGDAGH